MKRRFSGAPRSPTEPPTRTAPQEALRQLGRRPLSTRELAERLEAAGHGPEQMAAAVAEMRGYGYVNDPQLAEAVAASAERRGRGRGWVRSTLRQRGLADAAAPSTEPEQDERQEAVAAAALLSRRFAQVPDDPTALVKLRRRAYGFLLRRGFSVGSAVTALKQLTPGPRAGDDDPAPDNV